MSRCFMPCVGGAALVLTSLPLFADIAPPQEYVEECTLERQQGPEEECRVCDASFKGRDDCLALGAQGFEHRCRTYGASIWKELWCRTKSEQKKGL